ncbi:MAG: hypothetical protein AB1Z98_14775 [Nannocystaceae bacterium]
MLHDILYPATNKPTTKNKLSRETVFALALPLAALFGGGCDTVDDTSIEQEFHASLIEAGLEADSEELDETAALLVAAGLDLDSATVSLTDDERDEVAAELDEAIEELDGPDDGVSFRGAGFTKTGYGYSLLWCSAVGMATAQTRARKNADAKAQTTCGNSIAFPIVGTAHTSYSQANNHCYAAYTRMYQCL